MRSGNATKVSGFTLIELAASLAVVSILGLMIFPVVQLNIQRESEISLRQRLWEIRDALDRFRQAVEMGHIDSGIAPNGYPKSLEILTEGVVNKKTGQKIYFLARIPPDPMTQAEGEKAAWGIRSYQSSYNNPTSGIDVFDVYSTSNKVSIAGVPYRDW